MRRAAYLVVIAVAVVALAMSAVEPVGPRGNGAGAAAAVPAATVIPAIDLGALFGNENEPDENEPNGDAQNDAPAQGGSHSGVSLPLLLAAIGGALALLIAATLLVVRWVRRYRAWKQRVVFRARAGMRRLSDDFERRRRGF